MIPTITVSAVPTPDHIAYARLSGNVFKHKDNEKNENPYPNATAIDGPKMVNASESLSIVVANTSLIIDNVKNRYPLNCYSSLMSATCKVKNNYTNNNK